MLTKFLEQFISSPEVQNDEPLLCKLAGRFVSLLHTRERAERLKNVEVETPLLLSRDEGIVKREMLQAIKRNEWAAVSILAAELDLKSTFEKARKQPRVHMALNAKIESSSANSF